MAMNMNEAKRVKEVRLRGRATQKTKYMIIIDDDDYQQQGQAQMIAPLGAQLRVSGPLHQVIEDHVTHKLSRMATLQGHNYKPARQASKGQVFSARKTVKGEPSLWRRPTTRSSVAVCKSQQYYEKKNQAKIPELMNSKSEQYRKFLIIKCVSLINREYIVLQ